MLYLRVFLSCILPLSSTLLEASPKSTHICCCHLISMWKQHLTWWGEWLTCCHRAPGFQTQPWKRFLCEMFSLKFEEILSSSKSLKTIGSPVKSELGYSLKSLPDLGTPSILQISPRWNNTVKVKIMMSHSRSPSCADEWDCSDCQDRPTQKVTTNTLCSRLRAVASRRGSPMQLAHWWNA